MKVNYLEIELPLVGFFPKHSLGEIADRVKGLLTRDHTHREKLSYWQIIFLQSKANGCLYHGEDLPERKWNWPKDTWFQERLTGHLKSFERHTETVLKTPIDPAQTKQLTKNPPSSGGGMKRFDSTLTFKRLSDTTRTRKEKYPDYCSV